MIVKNLRSMVALLKCTLLALTLSVTGQAVAQSYDEPASWTVGDPNSTYQEWDFLIAGDGSPDVGNNNSAGTADYTISSPGYITGGGNSYSYLGDYFNNVILPNFDLGAGYQTTIILQIEKTLGPDESLISDPTVDGFAADSYDSVFDGIVNVPGQGDVELVIDKYTFVLSGNSSSYSIDWESSIHSSLWGLRVDSMTTAVPEVGTVAMCGIGMVLVGGMGAIRRRQLRNGGR